MFEKHKRIVDKKAIKQARKERCEVCGSTYHIRAVGYSQTGNDELNNLICLCVDCHAKVHNGSISKERLQVIRHAD